MAPSDNQPALPGFVVADRNTLDESNGAFLVPVLAESAEEAIEAVKDHRPGFRFGGIMSETLLTQQQKELTALRASNPAAIGSGFIVAGYTTDEAGTEHPAFYPVLSRTPESAVTKILQERPGLILAGIMPEHLLQNQIRDLAALRRQGASSH